MPSESIEKVERKIAQLSSKMQDESMVTGMRELKNYVHCQEDSSQTRERGFAQTKEKLKMFLLANDGTEISQYMKEYFTDISDEVEAIKAGANIGVFEKMFNSEKKESRKLARSQMEKAKQLRASQDATLKKERTNAESAPKVFGTLNETEVEFAEAYRREDSLGKTADYEREVQSFDKAFVRHSTKAKYLLMKKKQGDIDEFDRARLEFSTDSSDLYSKMYLRGLNYYGRNEKPLADQAAGLRGLSQVMKWRGSEEDYDDAYSGYFDMKISAQRSLDETLDHINVNKFGDSVSDEDDFDEGVFSSVDIYSICLEKMEYEIKMLTMLQNCQFMNAFTKTDDGAREYVENEKMLEKLKAARNYFDNVVKYVDAKEALYRGISGDEEAQKEEVDRIKSQIRGSFDNLWFKS